MYSKIVYLIIVIIVGVFGYQLGKANINIFNKNYPKPVTEQEINCIRDLKSFSANRNGVPYYSSGYY